MLGAISKSEAHEPPASAPLPPTPIRVLADTNPHHSFIDRLASMRATCASSERLATGHMMLGTSS